MILPHWVLMVILKNKDEKNGNMENKWPVKEEKNFKRYHHPVLTDWRYVLPIGDGDEDLSISSSSEKISLVSQSLP